VGFWRVILPDPNATAISKSRMGKCSIDMPNVSSVDIADLSPSFFGVFTTTDFGDDQAPITSSNWANRLRGPVFQHFASFVAFATNPFHGSFWRFEKVAKTVRTKDSKHLHLKVAFGRGGGLKSAFGRVSGVLIGSREREYAVNLSVAGAGRPSEMKNAVRTASSRPG
jgi:hypothetical protein